MDGFERNERLSDVFFALASGYWRCGIPVCSKRLLAWVMRGSLMTYVEWRLYITGEGYLIKIFV